MPLNKTLSFECMENMWSLLTFSIVFQTLVIKVSGVILSVVGGLAVGKVTECL